MNTAYEPNLLNHIGAGIFLGFISVGVVFLLRKVYEILKELIYYWINYRP